MRFVFGEDDPEELLLNPGDVVVIPPNVPHKATCIGEVEEIDMWAPPRAFPCHHDRNEASVVSAVDACC